MTECPINEGHGSLHEADMSPRIINGVMRWYEGDTFEIQLEINLKDQDGEKIDIRPVDELEIIFKNKLNELVQRFHYSGIVDNRITLEFTRPVSGQFPAGPYTYDIILSSANGRKTIANNNKVVVE